jgi:recombinational DNA repair protein (RecF pathway)
MPETEVIILRKTPWQESSLIVVGLSDGFGRLDFMVRGGKRVGARDFPAVDLFRTLHVEFRDGDGGLRPLLRADLVRDHDRLTDCPDHYFEACRIAAFILRHAPVHLPAPRLYRVLAQALAGLAGPVREANGPGWYALMRLVFLAEHGLLAMEDGPPDEAGHDAPTARRQRRLLVALLAAAEDDVPMPKLSPAYWLQFGDWLDSLCRHHDVGG